MIRLRVAPKDLGRYERAFGAAVRPALRRAAMEAAQRTLALVRRRTVTAPPASPRGAVGAVASRAYLDSWRAERAGDGARVYNTQPYAGVIDGGRRAGAAQPPVDALVPWVQRKLVVAQTRDRFGRFRNPDYRAVAFLVARAIKRRGLWPRRVESGAFPQAAAWFEQAVGQALDRILRGAAQAR